MRLPDAEQDSSGPLSAVRALVLGVSLLPGGAAVCAAEWKPSAVERPAGPDMTEGDSRLTLNALEALMRDPLLAPLNLGVSVQDHVITLWGPVPSNSLASRAQDLLNKIQGVAEVVSDLHTEPPADPYLDCLPVPPVSRPSPQSAVVAATSQAPGSLTGKMEKGNPTFAQGAVWSSPIAPLPAPPLLNMGRTSETALKPPVQLLAPVPMIVPPADLVRTIAGLQQGNDRLRRVQVRVEGGIVHLGGPDSSKEDLFELARTISQIPGVQRVILDEARPQR